MALTAERLRELLDYDPETGVFTRRKKTNRNQTIGEVAGHSDASNGGYVRVKIDGCLTHAHRLAWLYVCGEWPPETIDHIDGDPTNNRLANLRAATWAQNSQNAKRAAHNTSGFKGVHWCNTRKIWVASVKKCRKTYHVGFFDCPAAAYFARVLKVEKLHGEFARHG